MGPSLLPSPRSKSEEGAPVMTFRAPGATPISIADPGSRKPDEQKNRKGAGSKKPGGSKLALIVAAVVALAALSVAVGWFLTK